MGYHRPRGACSTAVVMLDVEGSSWTKDREHKATSLKKTSFSLLLWQRPCCRLRTSTRLPPRADSSRASETRRVYQTVYVRGSRRQNSKSLRNVYNSFHSCHLPHISYRWLIGLQGKNQVRLPLEWRAFGAI